MRSWVAIVIWLLLAVVLGAAVAPIVGGGRAMLVPVGWCVGGFLGGLGGAIFTVGSRRRETRLKRTMAAVLGAAMVAIFLAAASDTDLAGARESLWKAALALLAVVLVAPASVGLAFRINDMLR